MKKFTKIILIIAGSLAALGIVFSSIAAVMGAGWSTIHRKALAGELDFGNWHIGNGVYYAYDQGHGILDHFWDDDYDDWDDDYDDDDDWDDDDWDDEDDELMDDNRAVDLGACPGGWTYQLVKRNMWVYSVDNGPMAQSLMDTGQVTWLREDGFKFRPTRSNISWMVCDMVEKPAKVAALMAQWLVNGWCRETIFNLKLPMKKRYEEVSHNLAYIQAQLDEHGINAQIQARQLYHDREEVTVHVRRIWAAVGGRRDER